jgi:hypothetical protein
MALTAFIPGTTTAQNQATAGSGCRTMRRSNINSGSVNFQFIEFSVANWPQPHFWRARATNASGWLHAVHSATDAHRPMPVKAAVVVSVGTTILTLPLLGVGF